MVKQVMILSLFLVGLACGPLAAEQLGDPLRPPGASSTGARKASQRQVVWTLGAVLISPQRSVAMINGQAVQLGQHISGYRLVKVEQNRVVLQKNQKQIVVRRSGTGLKKGLPSEGTMKGSR